MPILDVEIVLAPRESLPPDLAASLADAAATALGTSPGGTWVKIRPLPHTGYAEDAGGPPEEVRPVFVRILKAALPSADAMQSEVTALTQAIARACNRPEANVHVLYEPEARGRLAFGGRLVPGS